MYSSLRRFPVFTFRWDLMFFASWSNFSTFLLPFRNFFMIAFWSNWFKPISAIRVLSLTRRFSTFPDILDFSILRASLLSVFTSTSSFLKRFTKVFLFVWLIFRGVRNERRFWATMFFLSSIRFLSKFSASFFIAFVFVFSSILLTRSFLSWLLNLL